MCNVTLDNGAE